MHILIADILKNRLQVLAKPYTCIDEIKTKKTSLHFPNTGT